MRFKGGVNHSFRISLLFFYSIKKTFRCGVNKKRVTGVSRFFFLSSLKPQNGGASCFVVCFLELSI